MGAVNVMVIADDVIVEVAKLVGVSGGFFVVADAVAVGEFPYTLTAFN